MTHCETVPHREALFKDLVPRPIQPNFLENAVPANFGEYPFHALR
jgi:hypothetical protein